MIYLQCNAHQAADNFALEYWLTEHQFPGEVFLLWWTEPTIMLGKYQDALAEVNQEYADRQHLTIVRRLSGGGTIFTDPGSLQYSFIKPSPKKNIDFTSFLGQICAALQKLGVAVRRSSRNDLTINGRKFSGNAQYYHNGYVVHHGSLLFDTNVDEMTAALHVDPMKLRAKKISSVHQRVLNLHSVLPKLTRDEFAAQLQAAVLGQAGQTHQYRLTVADRQAIRQIKERTFANPAFIYGQTSKTTISKERYFQGGGLVKLALTVDHGYLKQLHITGDFFSDLNVRALEKALCGRLFQPATIRPILEHWLRKYPIRNISADQLLNLLFA